MHRLNLNFNNIPKDIKKNIRPSTANWSDRQASDFIHKVASNPTTVQPIQPLSKIKTG
jgi:hypothetical protein